MIVKGGDTPVTCIRYYHSYCDVYLFTIIKFHFNSGYYFLSFTFYQDFIGEVEFLLFACRWILIPLRSSNEVK